MWNADNNTPEMLCLRMCCRYALGQMHASDCAPYLEQASDDEGFIALLHEHRLLVLVYQVLSSDFKNAVSERLLQKLKDKVTPIIHHQLVLMRTAQDVQQVFQQHGVSHVFLKGPVLNKILWGRKMMRYSRDLDVLVLPREIFKANAALRLLGFQSELSEKSLFFHQRFSAWTTKKDAAYWKKHVPYCLELHWKTHCTEFIFPALKNMETLPQLTDEEHALYLCLHAAKHGWLRMIWLVDIVALVQKKQLDVLRVRALAKTRNITPVVEELILLAEQWLGVRLCSSDMMIAMGERNARLQQRVVSAKKAAGNDFFHDVVARYFANAFCSRHGHQVCLWGQVFLGAIISKGLSYARDLNKTTL